MSIPSSQIISLWMQEELSADSWVPIRTLAIDTLRKRWGKPELALEELIDDKLAFIGEHLRDDLAERLIDGKVADFEIDNEQPPYLRRLLPRQPSLLEKMRKINPFAFEMVCSRVLEALGGEAEVTQKTNDGGIDFTATKLKIIHSSLPLPHSCHAVVIGQAKRYKEGSAISETRLREFVGASILKRHRMAAEAMIPPLMPTLFAFWTTSDLDPNAKKYARSVGLWYMDGPTLSAYARELGLEEYINSLPDDCDV
jgi:hypothetical protein